MCGDYPYDLLSDYSEFFYFLPQWYIFEVLKLLQIRLFPNSDPDENS